MASLFEERALLDLVRGLKTLRGGCKAKMRIGNKEGEGVSHLITTVFHSVSTWIQLALVCVFLINKSQRQDPQCVSLSGFFPPL